MIDPVEGVVHLVRVLEDHLSVHEMSSESTWRETAVFGCKGPSVYGRNLGTSAQCSNGLLRQEEPHGSARCRDEYSGRRAGSPGTDHVCQGQRGEACGARNGARHLQTACA